MTARAVGDGLRRRLRNTARRLMLGIHAGLQETTPVDTGFAVTNWVPTVGAPSQGTAGTRAEAEAGQLDRAPAERGVSELRAYELSQGDLFDTNNVDYIRKLNAGSSAQAPAAFVQGAIVRSIEALSEKAVGE